MIMDITQDMESLSEALVWKFNFEKETCALRIQPFHYDSTSIVVQPLQ